MIKNVSRNSVREDENIKFIVSSNFTNQIFYMFTDYSISAHKKYPIVNLKLFVENWF